MDCRGENTTAVIRLVSVEPPASVEATDPPDVVIGQNTIYVPAGGLRLWFEVCVSNWDPEQDESPVLRTWQAQIHPSSFVSGTSGRVAPASEVACDPRDWDSCKPVFGRCSYCREYATGSSVCSFAFVDASRADEISVFAGPDISTPAIRFGGTELIDIRTDDGTEGYGGTVVLDVSPDATGTFPIGFNPDRHETFL